MNLETNPFRLNPAARVHVESLAGECQLLVVDDVYADPLAVRSLALTCRYDSSLAYYPGVHSALDAERLGELFDGLARLLGALGTSGLDRRSFTSDFSIVTTPAAKMLAQQKHPHIDGDLVAGVLYLSPHSEVGTSFFRHLPSGRAMLRTLAERDAHAAWLRQHGEATQPTTYAVEQEGVWQHLHTVVGRFNRLVMYPGLLFHSIDMRDVQADHTIATSRLTQRLFVQPPSKPA